MDVIVQQREMIKNENSYLGTYNSFPTLVT